MSIPLRQITQHVRGEVKWFVALMMEKGDESAFRQVEMVTRALQANSPMMFERLKLAWDNCMRCVETEPEERRRFGELLALLYPNETVHKSFRFEMRLDRDDRAHLDLIKSRSECNETYSEIIRRLLWEEAQRLGVQ